MAVVREYIVMALVDRNFGYGACILMTYNDAALYHKGVNANHEAISENDMKML